MANEFRVKNGIITGGDITPDADDSYDLGSSTAAFQDLFLEGDIILTDAGTVKTTAGDLTIESASDLIITATKVGIGTSDPDQLLHVVGGSNDDTVALFSTAGGTGGSTQGSVHIGLSHFSSDANPSVRIGAEENGNGSFQAALTFGTRSATSDAAPAERMRIAHDGNVGIGESSPLFPLHLKYTDDRTDPQGSNANSGAGAIGANAQGGGLYIENESTTDGSFAGITFRTDTADGRIAYQSTGSSLINEGQMSFYCDSNDTNGQQLVLEEVLRLTGGGSGAAQSFNSAYVNGRIGIGTTSPTAELDVHGTILANPTGTYSATVGSGSDTSTTAGIVFDGNADIFREADGYLRRVIGASSSTITIGQDGTSIWNTIDLIPGHSGKIRLYSDNPSTNSAELTMTIDDAKVGIGTTSPQSQLDVRGAAGAPGTLTLSTAETTVEDGDKLGRIDFNAPSEADGTDAILIGASIWAEADDTFAADNNKTELVFATGASEAAAEQMRLTFDGKLGIGTSTPSRALDVNGDIRVGGNDILDSGGVAITFDGSQNTSLAGNLTVTGTTSVGGADVLVAGAQTAITTDFNAGRKVGRDADNLIDFSTDNEITFRAKNADRLVLSELGLQPSSDNSLELGDTGTRLKSLVVAAAAGANEYFAVGTTNNANNMALVRAAATPKFELFTWESHETTNATRVSMKGFHNSQGTHGMILKSEITVNTSATGGFGSEELNTNGPIQFQGHDDTYGFWAPISAPSSGQMGALLIAKTDYRSELSGVGTPPQSQLEVRSPAGGPGTLTLSTEELTVVDGDKLGRIDFNAPKESDGTDAIAIAASIWAEADDTFAADNNSTDLVFATGASGAATEKMRLTHNGLVGIGTNDPSTTLDVAGDITGQRLNLLKSSGYASIEIGGPSGAFMDFKNDITTPDDFDVRLITTGTGLDIITANASSPIKLKTQGTTRVTVEDATTTVGNNLVVSGNFTVNGTTTTVDTATLAVEDPLIILASGNDSADTVDIGFYGLYDTSGSQDLYAGLFRDADDSGKFKLFKDLQAAPGTTVNTSGTGYAVATLVANIEGSITGSVTGSAATVTGATQAAITTVANVTTVGALNAGSITSGFGSIDNGTSGIRSNNITAETAFLPDASDGATLGSATKEFSDLYLADGAQILFGDDQDITMTHVADTGLRMEDSHQLIFGTDSDFKIYHDGSTGYVDNDTGTLRIQAAGEVWIDAAGSSNVMRIKNSEVFSFRDVNINNKITLDATTGALVAVTKSFDIAHPTKEGKRLHHGVLEGPEHAVYHRGVGSSRVVDLPDYWTGLVDEDSITVQLTPRGGFQSLYVSKIEGNRVYVDSDHGEPLDFYFLIHGERKDVDKLVVEY